jgi:LysM repeat protein
MTSVKRVTGLLALAALALPAFACSPVARANEEAYQPPPPLALVAIVDPSQGRLPAQLRQLQDVIKSGATPNEAVVVMLLEPSFGATYVVQKGDSLSSIAAAHGLTLGALEAANPQFGPLSGRNWKLIYSGERVLLPNGASTGALLLATKAPAGPPPPTLVRVPAAPNNPTDYQRAQHEHAVASATATNQSRIAAWNDAVSQALQPWQAQVVAQLDGVAAANTQARPPDAPMLAASVQAAQTTLQGLKGRRVLLVLGGGDAAPSSLPARSLDGVELVIANLSDAGATARWESAATTTGAVSVTALDAALTQLKLTQVVDHQT